MKCIWLLIVIAGIGNAISLVFISAQAGLKKLLDSMVELQTALLVRNQDTKVIATGGEQKVGSKRQRTTSGGGGSDEEIDSDEAEGLGSDGDGEDGRMLSRDTEKRLFKKIKMADYPQFLAQRHKDFTAFRCTFIKSRTSAIFLCN